MYRFSKYFSLQIIIIALTFFLFNSCRENDDFELTLPRGEIISSTLLHHYTKHECDSIIDATDPILADLPVDYAVDAYKIIYKTIDADGNITQASGAVFIPVDHTDKFPLVSYQHGTILEKEDVPSRLNYESVLGVIYAPAGYIFCMPDYLGLGDSPGLHPYCHSKTEASAVVDLLLAAKNFCLDNDTQLNDQLFLLGYSQGGHATMAATKEIQENYADEFTITASAPMSGPYDMSGAQTEVVLSDVPYDAPYYLPYLMFAYNEVYHMYASPSDFLQAPYDVTLPPLFDGYHSSGEVDAAMPSIPKQIIKPDVLADFITNANNPFKLALEDNDLYNWLPTIPMIIYYCGADELVSAQNSIHAYDSFIANGSTSVTLIQPDPAGTHESCAEPCLFFARNLFDGLKN